MLLIRKLKANHFQYACRSLTVSSDTINFQKPNTKHDSKDNIPVDVDLKRRFIPITRRTLVRKILEQNYLVPPVDSKIYKKFMEGLDKAVAQRFHGTLSKLKQFYDPLNPDNETIINQHHGSKDRLEIEYQLLHALSSQLQLASFQQLTREQIVSVLSDHPVREDVLVQVDLKKYDVLKFWVLSEDLQPLYANNFVERVRNLVNVYWKKHPKETKTYKRVVVAVRTKKQNKLMLKAFKDVPQVGLAYLLPEGRISISKYDKGLISTTVGIGALSALLKLISTFSSYYLSWTYVVCGISGVVALRSWNAYKNKRNNYLVNLSKFLYFKNIANNRALLTLIVDRAEDELLKSCLLAYIFTRTENILKGSTSDDVAKWLTMGELKDSVDRWLKSRCNVQVDFDPQPALKMLEELNLLTVRRLGSNHHLSVVSLQEAVSVLPHVTVEDILSRQTQHAEDLDVEDVLAENDFEVTDRDEKEKQRLAESTSSGWNSK